MSGLVGCGGAGSSEGNAAPLTYTNRLRLPPLLEPEADGDGVRRFALTLQTGMTEFFAGKPAATWGFNGSYLGPTLRARKGDRVAMKVTNQLPESTTVHWHGMRLPAVMDGGPHQTIEPKATWTPEWKIEQSATTLWYHPHPHGATSMHVYRGLAGMFIIDDAEADGLSLPSSYGVDDFPIIVQDKTIEANGTLSEDTRPTFGIMGNHILVNGTYDPFLEVTTSRVRLRILNASNARTYHLGFSDGRPFHVIGTDSGMLRKPVQTDRVLLSPAERADVVVEFATGDEVVLQSSSGDDDIDEGDFNLLKIRAAGRLKASPALPGKLTAAAPIAASPGARVRRFTLNGHDAVNKREMDMSRIDEVIPAGALEIWEIENTVYAHNFHIHEAAFRVLSIDGKAPPAYADGPKDTVYIPPKATARLAVQFGRHTDPVMPYMFHCHILRHEDEGMMGQFVVVEPGTEGSVSRTIPTHGHG